MAIFEHHHCKVATHSRKTNPVGTIHATITPSTTSIDNDVVNMTRTEAMADQVTVILPHKIAMYPRSLTDDDNPHKEPIMHRAQELRTITKETLQKLLFTTGV